METTGINLSQRPIDELIASLCSQLAAQRERIAALEALATSRADDAMSAQLLAREAIHALHREHQAHVRLRARHDAVIAELRDRRRSLERAA